MAHPLALDSIFLPYRYLDRCVLCLDPSLGGLETPGVFLLVCLLFLGHIYDSMHPYIFLGVARWGGVQTVGDGRGIHFQVEEEGTGNL